jgi:hypothetical protein
MGFHIVRGVLEHELGFGLRLGGIFTQEVELAQLQLSIYVLGIQLHASIQSAKGRA